MLRSFVLTLHHNTCRNMGEPHSRVGCIYPLSPGTRCTSGFRAYSKEAALQMNVISDFTYTVETIISAGNKNLAIEHTPVRTNKKLRESRLFPSIQVYLRRTLVTMLKVYSMYRPLKLFTIAGGTIFLIGFAIGCR